MASARGEFGSRFGFIMAAAGSAVGLGNIWGFPTQYIVPILLGWFGLAGVSLVMTLVCNKFDDEMDAYVKSQEKKNVTVTE